MVKLAIRDDDTNYFTKIEDLEFVYEKIIDFPISLAVVPTVLDLSTKGACKDTHGNKLPQFIGDNKKLVDYLKENVSRGKYEILLHGITHEYKFVENVRLAEMEWRNTDASLFELLAKWKRIFEILFDAPIKVFVAPSNKIKKRGIKAVYSNAMNYSGIVSIKFERDFNFGNFVNYFKRFIVRLFCKIPYPGVLDYKTHKEINACLMQGEDYLKKIFNYCNNNNLPMVINVHYWHLRDNPKELQELYEFCQYAVTKGAIPSLVSQCLEE